MVYFGLHCGHHLERNNQVNLYIQMPQACLSQRPGLSLTNRRKRTSLHKEISGCSVHPSTALNVSRNPFSVAITAYAELKIYREWLNRSSGSHLGVTVSLKDSCVWRWSGVSQWETLLIAGEQGS